MHIVVIGLGEVGRHLLSVLDNEGHDVVAVDGSPAAVRYAEEHFDVASIVGYGASQEVLDQAGVSRADLVVAVTNHDEVNLIAALAAKQLGAKQAVARAQGDEWARWTEGIRYGLLGVDVVINPRVLVAQELARVARSHGASDVIDLSQDRVELVQIEMGDESRLFNKALKNVDLPKSALVAAIVRDGVLEVPGGDDVFQKNDRVYLIGKPEGVLAAETRFSKTREARRVCIVGGGVVGKALAQELVEAGARVKLIERDADVAEVIAAELDGVDIVVGDGTNQGRLEEEEVDTYDLFAAVTAMDEVNLMASLQAKRVGCERTAVTVQRADYVPIYKQLGIDIVLSPRTVASDHILRLSRGGNLHSLVVIEDGQAEVVELTVSPECPAVGRELIRLRDFLPKGALLGAIVRGDNVIIPHGSNTIEAGDRVIVMTKSEGRKAVERIFRPRRL